MDNKALFQEATLRICGSLDIEVAMQDCLRYLRRFIPVRMLSFHLYDHALGVGETVAHATVDDCRVLSLYTPFSAAAQRQIVHQRKDRVRLLQRMGDDVVARAIARNFDALNLSGLIMDLGLEGQFVGVVSVAGEPGVAFNQSHVALFKHLNQPFTIALTNYLRHRELKRIKETLADDKQFFQNELRRQAGDNLVGANLGLKTVVDRVHKVAHLDSPVLLLGKTGTGKEILANMIHNLSPRRERPFVKVNCGAIPPALIDSDLFGHEKGAFTGAVSRTRGRFERADGGTLFLDEIGELPLDAQVRLLRAIQEKEIERVGGNRTIRVDIRIIAATHRDLKQLIERGRFREDLYFRLTVFPIVIPPLCDRVSDIPALTDHFIRKKSVEMKRTTVPALAAGALDRLIAYPWPGNVRELENTIEREMIIHRHGELTFADLHPIPDAGSPPAPMPAQGKTLQAFIREKIVCVMEQCRGRVEGEKGAARVLDVHPSTLRKKMEKLGIPFGRKAGRLYGATTTKACQQGED